MTGKLAVLIPVFNGGSLLRESVASCAQCGLPPESYEVIVVDNCSTDGAVDELPTKNADGAHIQIHRNAANLGRIGNWNRAVEIAEAQGFTWAVFLFVGDLWVPDGTLRDILSSMEACRAEIALGSHYIFDVPSNRRRFCCHIDTSGAEILIPGQSLVQFLMERGLTPVCPLQSNVYRLRSDRRLRFDPDEPSLTDIVGTILFLSQATGPALVTSKAFLAWRLHSARYFRSKDALEFPLDMFKILRIAEERTGLHANWSHAKSVFWIGALLTIKTYEPWYRWPRLIARSIRDSRQQPGSIDLPYILGMIWRKVFWNKSPIYIDP
jgi:glycosyltransferase involved in cell wall biosynthesis